MSGREALEAADSALLQDEHTSTRLIKHHQGGGRGGGEGGSRGGRERGEGEGGRRGRERREGEGGGRGGREGRGRERREGISSQNKNSTNCMYVYAQEAS